VRVKSALTAVAVAALFLGVVFVGGRFLGVWEEVAQSKASAPPRVLALEATTYAEEAVDRDETAPRSAESARRNKAKARWIREANALCTGATREARVLARKYENPSGLEDVLALGEATLQGERRFLDRLAGLKRPTAERPLIRQMLAIYETHHRFFRRTVSAVRRNDIEAALQAGLRADDLMTDAQGMLAFQLGARKCSASGSGRGNGLTLGVASTG
jgi:hypothetical protein